MQTQTETASPAGGARVSGLDDGPRCQIVRTLDVIGEKWSLLVVRDALRGRSRFSEFRDSLGASTDILTDRLAKLVAAGVLEKRAYREAGSRERSSYHLTESGRGLALVAGAMIQWGDTFNPYPGGRSSRVVDAATGAPLRLAFVDESGQAVPDSSAAIVPGPAARTTW
ncbi:helix-turn-helix domain-containing protein [Herbiconiux sp.]|uniref:winged helix-turn-helix transcriptional regulator n=1 Tax=Herbiconiux sp. TaxID=1871186 RepID=UPI0025C6D580|nr:helix-turn-helix domain-containing protein [Herbiconiux sp.]